EVTRALKLFAQEPYACPMLFHGESGVGKTSAALALAAELGCAVDEEELGGLHEIASGEQTGATVKEKFAQLRLYPLFGSGWRCLIVNEADSRSEGAENIWLDALEHLPAKSVVIFTTNAVNRISRRLRDRCEVYHFTSDTSLLKLHIQQLAQQVWETEGCAGE